MENLPTFGHDKLGIMVTIGTLRIPFFRY